MATNTEILAKANALINKFEEKEAAIDAKIAIKETQVESMIAAKEAAVDSYLVGARGEQSHFRLTANQTLSGTTGSPPTGWYSHPDCSYELVETVVDGVVHANRSALAQEFLETMYPAGVQYLHQNFNIWRMTWVNRPGYSLYQRSSATQEVTHMAICKLVSGGITGWWSAGAELGVCKVTGSRIKYGDLGYTHCHPIPQTDTGELLFALPAVVTGYVDLTDGESFGWFPYIGDTQND